MEGRIDGCDHRWTYEWTHGRMHGQKYEFTNLFTYLLTTYDDDLNQPPHLTPWTYSLCCTFFTPHTKMSMRFCCSASWMIFFSQFCYFICWTKISVLFCYSVGWMMFFSRFCCFNQLDKDQHGILLFRQLDNVFSVDSAGSPVVQDKLAILWFPQLDYAASLDKDKPVRFFCSLSWIMF